MLVDDSGLSLSRLRSSGHNFVASMVNYSGLSTVLVLSDDNFGLSRDLH